MGRTVLLVVTLGIAFLGNANAQYNISSNEKLFLASASEVERTDHATATVQNFFNLAQKGQRSEWEQLLARNCYKDGIPREYVNRWFDHLAHHKVKYTIGEISSPKTNQKIIYYSSSGDSNEKKIMVLVKEKGRWKIYHADL